MYRRLLTEYAEGRRDFRGLNLQRLTLPPEADLSNADFSNADLRGANLRGANLAGSRFCGAKFGVPGGIRLVRGAIGWGLAATAGLSFAALAVVALGLLGDAPSPVYTAAVLGAAVFMAAFYGIAARWGLGRVAIVSVWLVAVGLALLAASLGLMLLQERYVWWREALGAAEIPLRLTCAALCGLCLTGGILWVSSFARVVAVTVARWPTAACMVAVSWLTGWMLVGFSPEYSSLVEITAGSLVVVALFLSLDVRLARWTREGDRQQRFLREAAIAWFRFGNATDFARTDLTGADLTGTDLRGVSFRGARLGGVVWPSGRHSAWAQRDEAAIEPGAPDSSKS